MSSPTFTPNLGLILLPTGSQAGTWGTTTNGTIGFIDTATDGSLSVALSASNSFTLTTNQNAASNGHNKVVEFTGTITADVSINIAPVTAQKLYFIQNHTIGGFNLIVQQGSGPVYRIQAGHSAIVYCNGAGATAAVFGVTSDLQVDTLLVSTSLMVQGTFNISGALTSSQPATFSGGVTISPSLAVNLGSDAPYDMYYRSAAGSVARLPNGGAGQFLQATAAGPQWATVNTSIGIGTPIVSGVGWGLLYVDSGATLRQSPQFNVVPGVGMGVGFMPTHTLHVGGLLAAECWIDGAATSVRRMILATASVARAALGLTTDAESGGSAGSNLAIQSFNDAASIANTHLAGFRATGHTTIGAYADLGGVFNVYNQLAPATPAVIVRGISGQTGDLQQWQNSAGGVVAHIDAGGNHYTAGGYYTSGGVVINASGQFVSGAGIDMHGAVIVCSEYAIYDTSNIRHDGFTGQVQVVGGTANCINGIIVRN